MTSGSPDATEALVFVHGNHGPTDDWTDLLARVGAFARDCTEMPGHRHRQARNFAYTAPVLHRPPRRILDQLGVQRAHLARESGRRATAEGTAADPCCGGASPPGRTVKLNDWPVDRAADEPHPGAIPSSAACRAEKGCGQTGYSSTISAVAADAFTLSAAWRALALDAKLSPEEAVVWPLEATSFQRSGVRCPTGSGS